MPLESTSTNALSDLAERNIRHLHKSNATILNVVGAPGCGKTSLIGTTLWRLKHDLAVGALVCGGSTRHDALYLGAMTSRVEALQVEPGRCVDSSQLHEALSHLGLAQLDLLLIENVNTGLLPPGFALPNVLQVAVFSVDGAGEQPGSLPDLTGGADVVVLNKIDLLPRPGFDLNRFRAAAHALHPLASQFELSLTEDQGIADWVEWLRILRTPGIKTPVFAPSEAADLTSAVGTCPET